MHLEEYNFHLKLVPLGTTECEEEDKPWCPVTVGHSCLLEVMPFVVQMEMLRPRGLKQFSKVRWLRRVGADFPVSALGM